MRVCVSELAGLLSGSTAVCPLFMINLLSPLRPHKPLGFPLHWGRDPGCQLPGTWLLRTMGSRDGE